MTREVGRGGQTLDRRHRDGEPVGAVPGLVQHLVDGLVRLVGPQQHGSARGSGRRPRRTGAVGRPAARAHSGRGRRAGGPRSRRSAASPRCPDRGCGGAALGQRPGRFALEVDERPLAVGDAGTARGADRRGCAGPSRSWPSPARSASASKAVAARARRAAGRAPPEPRRSGAPPWRRRSARLRPAERDGRQRGREGRVHLGGGAAERPCLAGEVTRPWHASAGPAPSRPRTRAGTAGAPRGACRPRRVSRFVPSRVREEPGGGRGYPAQPSRASGSGSSRSGLTPGTTRRNSFRMNVSP